MHKFQQLTDQLDRRICAIGRAERRRDDEWNARLHVLGCGMSIVEACLYNSSEFMRRGCWSGCDYVQHSDPDAATTSKLIPNILQILLSIRQDLQEFAKKPLRIVEPACILGCEAHPSFLYQE